jgi:hypothetical protein
MRDPLLKLTTPLSALVPAHDEQQHIASSLNRLNGRRLRGKTFGLWRIMSANFLPPLSLIAVLRKPQLEGGEEVSSSSFRPESASHEAAN